MTDPVRPNDALIKINLNGREYDARYVRNCHTCTHPARVAIEEMVLGHHPYRAISDQYSEIEIEDEHGRVFTTPEITWQSIRNHYKNGHMPLGVAALRKLADKRSEEMAEQYAGTIERYVDRYDVARTIMQKGYDQIVAGNFPIDVKDTLAAAKFLHDADQGSTVDAEAWSQAMQVYFETVQRIVPEEMWQQIATELSVNPVLKALEQKAAAQEAGIVDAEIVSDDR